MGESVRTYRPGDEDFIAALLRECFDTYRNYGIDGSKWLELAKLNEGFRPEGAYLLEEEGSLVSHIQVVEKRLRTAAGPQSTAGIANVATHPSRRGRGYATRLLEKAMKDYAAKCFPLTALFTGFASGPQRIYRRLGYVDVCVDTYAVAPLSDAKTAARRVPWIEVCEGEERDVEKLARLYEERGDRHTGWPTRTRQEWVEKLVKRTAYHGFFYVERSRGNFLVAREGGEVLGHVATFKAPWEEETLTILEIMSAPGRFDALQALYTAAIERASELGARVVRASIPMVGSYAKIFRNFQRSGGGGVFMTEVLNLRALLSTVKVVGWIDEPLTLKLLYRSQQATVKVGHEGLELVEGGAEAEMELDPTMFNRMLFGFASLSEVLLSSRVSSSVPLRRIREALKAIFKPKPFHIWIIDHW
ncbi:MAG: GNAT family N-acetyltransferase [Thermofilum sp.]